MFIYPLIAIFRHNVVFTKGTVDKAVDEGRGKVLLGRVNIVDGAEPRILQVSLVDVFWFFWLNDVKLQKDKEYIWNQNGDLDKKYIWNQNGDLDKEYIGNQNGDLDKEYIGNQNGDLDKEYIWNQNGDLDQEHIWNQNGDLDKEYIWNQNGDLDKE